MAELGALGANSRCREVIHLQTGKQGLQEGPRQRGTPRRIPAHFPPSPPPLALGSDAAGGICCWVECLVWTFSQRSTDGNDTLSGLGFKS